VLKVFIALFGGVGLIFMSVGAGMAWHQNHTIRTSVPVAATIVAMDIEKHVSHSSKGGTTTTYKPIVEYRYEVDGRSYVSRTVFPLSESGSYGWARSVVDRFSPGQRVEAYRNSRRPEKAFLIRRYSFFPYFFVVFASVFVSIGAGVGAGASGTGAKPARAVPAAEGWCEVLPLTRVANYRRGVWTGCLMFETIGILAFVHYFKCAAPSFEVTAFVAAAIYALVGGGAWAAAVYYGRLAGSVADARLFINRANLARGEPVTVGARQAFRQPLQVKEVNLALLCEETNQVRRGSKTTTSVTVCHRQDAVALRDKPARPGQPLEYTAIFTPPKEAMPSSPSEGGGYPRYNWKVRLDVTLAKNPDYHAEFPVNVV
jgi:hypothetical protein